MKSFIRVALLVAATGLPQMAGNGPEGDIQPQNNSFKTGAGSELASSPKPLQDTLFPEEDGASQVKPVQGHTEAVLLEDPLVVGGQHAAAPGPEDPAPSQGLDNLARAAEPGKFQPMILETNDGPEASAEFLADAPTLVRSNHLAYVRGKEYTRGHELTYSKSLAGWKIRSFEATRGFRFLDPNAGFVAYNEEKNQFNIVWHGSINNADWITNFASVAVRFDSYKYNDGTAMLPMVGQAHFGFLTKYLSSRSHPKEGPQTDLMGLIDRMIAEDVPPGKLPGTRYRVTGHSQGAALAQITFVHLCQHLRKYYGPDFNNAKENRVHAWLLACPLVLDATAGAFAKAIGGCHNMFIQNIGLDLVPNAGLTPRGRELKSVGTKGRQDSAQALYQSLAAHMDSVRKHIQNGDLTVGLYGMLPHYVTRAMVDIFWFGTGASPFWMTVGLGSQVMNAFHFANDDVNYRDVGNGQAFNEEMVAFSPEGIRKCLREAHEHKQRKAQPASGVWQWLGWGSR